MVFPEEWIIPLFVFIIFGVSIYQLIYGGEVFSPHTEITPETLKIGENLPVLWLFYSEEEIHRDSQGSQGSQEVLSIPFLNLCYRSILKHNGKKYRIEVLRGILDVALLLPRGFDAIPDYLQYPGKVISANDEKWIKKTILNSFGGTWVSPYTISVNPFTQDGVQEVGIEQMFSSPNGFIVNPTINSYTFSKENILRSKAYSWVLESSSQELMKSNTLFSGLIEI